MVIVYYFLNDNYDLTNTYIKKFYEHGFFNENLELGNRKKMIVNLKKIGEIKTCLDDLCSQAIQYGEGFSMNNASCNTITNGMEHHSDTTMEEEIKTDIHSDNQTKDLLYFELKELTNEQKIYLADSIFLRYFLTLGYYFI